MAKSASPEEEEIVISAAPQVAKSGSSWGPAIAVMILMPLISYGMTQSILIPKLKASLGEPAATTGVVASAAAAKGAAGAHGAPKKDEKPTSFECPFENIVVNLSGAKGTRYLKTSFTMVSSNPDLKAIINQHRIELMDLTLNILAGKTLADLEAPGAYNMLRHDLTENFNQVLNSTIVEQIYFTEHVVQ